MAALDVSARAMALTVAPAVGDAVGDADTETEGPSAFSHCCARVRACQGARGARACVLPHAFLHEYLSAFVHSRMPTRVWSWQRP